METKLYSYTSEGQKVAYKLVGVYPSRGRGRLALDGTRKHALYCAISGDLLSITN